MNSIGVDAVVDLRQFTLRTPPYLRLLLLFEALELFNQINFKWYANGRTELKRYVLGAYVPPYFPFFTIIPMASAFSTHSETLSTKLGSPASDLKWSNSTNYCYLFCLYKKDKPSCR